MRSEIRLGAVLLAMCAGAVCGCSKKPPAETPHEPTAMELNQIFRNGMILQAGKSVRVFGSGDGRATVSIEGTAGDERVAAADSFNGKWLVELDAVDYGGPYTLTVSMENRGAFANKNVTCTDVWFGDVYLLAGQSNMQFKMKEGSYPSEQWELSGDIRYYSVQSKDSSELLTPKDGWVSGEDADHVANMSMLGYLTALQQTKKTGHKVGLVGCYQGASVIEAWLPEEICGKEIYNSPVKHLDHDKYPWNSPAVLYRYMFETIAPFRFSHIFWYQGESNTAYYEARNYDKMVVDLVNCWRTDLQDGTLPFVLIQIADYLYGDSLGWAALQASQARVPSLLNNILFVSTEDVDEEEKRIFGDEYEQKRYDRTAIHPANKTAWANCVFRLLGE